ncbi:hypothetical protein HK103_000797 [Boothiomyces macroporosus]|uniref:Cytochrome b5 heme-binding domain-containing protein n=1 Tax=Boothiomyces macroporosus TaxID=261099 RepID=A0AAD5Y5E0_9FUNG|nr:hypothetical protein HK103_000797 [Boothiomyces macroporosus]
MSFLGMAHRRSMIVENKLIESKKIAWITGGHRWLGRVLVVVAFIQAALGLQVLYPWEELKFRGVGYWITYFINAIFWLLLFVLAELYRKYRFELPGIKYKRIGNKLQKIENKRDPVLSVISDKPKFYTWKDIAEEMEKDNLLVVAEGKYVIQINSWLNNHPGGSIILRSVAGTDITPDYFNESGFDIEGFIPRTIEQLPRKRTFTPTKESQQEKRISIDKKPKYTPEQEQAPLSISKSEWDAVLKARRTHVHSRLAIKKLSQMIVGELTTNTTETRFDKYENRRYAIVSKTLENSSQSNPIYRIKFALLYPFERRTHQPQILPGQSVLIRYFYNRQYQQCHYTPVTNDLNAFEIYVKSYPEGNVSRFLTEQEPGKRQFQISGPFGDPIFNPYYSIKDTASETSTLISGYIPAQRDELFISRGDYVVVFNHIIGEGWAYGLNMTTNNKGMFPLSITFPPTPTKLAVLNTCKSQKDIFGKDIVSHALLSYPIEFSILHLLTKEDLEQSETFGNCIGGRIDENIIKKMLNDLWDYTRSKSQIVLIIGPNEMQGNVTDLLLSNGLEQTDLKIFGNSQRLIAKKKIDGIGLLKEAINSVS